jgi:hypothetical protein
MEDTKIMDLIPEVLREKLVQEVLDLLEKRKNNPSEKDIGNEIKKCAESKK